MSKKHTIFLLLGSNIHPRTVYLNKAIGFIDKSLGEIISVSSVYESEPWGFEASVAFLNRVVCIESTFESLEILEKTQQIERFLGRTTKTSGEYVSRTLDIDLLFFDDEIINLPELTVPHVQIVNRRFTLIPLAEVDPAKIHPVLKRTCRQLLDSCTDGSKVWKYKEKQTYAL